MHYPIALKFGTLKGGIKVHPDTKFGCNTINGHKVINNYLQKITPICCHANDKKLKFGKETIEPQTFCQ